MMPPVEHQVCQSQEEKEKRDWFFGCPGVIIQLFHDKHCRSINQHIPAANHRPQCFPLYGDITHNIVLYKIEQVHVGLRKGDEKEKDTGRPAPYVNWCCFEIWSNRAEKINCKRHPGEENDDSQPGGKFEVFPSTEFSCKKTNHNHA